MITQVVRSRHLKHLLLASIMGLGLLAARDASAQACWNDDDCPEPACGGQVCDWSTGAMICKPPGSQPKGVDGWCMDDTDCKCMSLGAMCKNFFCTFTRPSDAPGGGATGGASGTGGSAAGTGGSAAGTGGSSSGNDGGTQPAKDDGGCAIAGGGASSWLGALIAVAGLVVLGRRRRRRQQSVD